MKDCTILLQGKINKECFDLWIKNYSNNLVIVSVWETEDISELKIPKNWKLVINDWPKKRYKKDGNIDLQIISTINGLRNVKTDWVIKARLDEYWSNLDLVYKKMTSNSNKIISSSMYFRKWGLYDFHIGDKIIAGKVSELSLMFNVAFNIIEKNVLTTNIPETYLGLGYIVAKGDIDFNEKFIYSLNYKETKFDKKSSLDAVKSANDAIKKNFSNIIKKGNSIEISKINESLEHCKKIIEYCINYNELVEKLKSRVDVSDKKLMKKYFEIIDINELKPYIATRKFTDEASRVWFRNDFDNKKENCLTNINEKN